ncbi:hypothetical protein R1sor_002921 [Riccia sorocarpa]|uniref:Auxin response factor n=1 Tax=Riccia sorocarpa TaxID=122646 RepID=A0ABD3H2W5_9MARC
MSRCDGCTGPPLAPRIVHSLIVYQGKLTFFSGEQRSLNSELWHACAGPLVSVPPVGSRVVYFPQGHSEQVAASTQKEADVHIPSYPSLPPRLICLLDNVTLHADMETDEVYTRMTLIPLSQSQEKEMVLTPEVPPRETKQPTDFFCKTLTASDTSTHGGFSIPRRAAEKVFPPLDYSQQPPAHPAQELVARDLHDQEWHFRHIYRGQPRRHLLTTGWSVFVSSKRLQAGDSVLFIRDDKGQLLLGIRRANRQQTAMPSSVLTSDSMHIGVLAAANHAAATNSRFTIFYNPRASPSEFVIPLWKYHKAIYQTQVSVGMRFRMVFETEESGVRRYTGTITGIGDLDPVRWPNSHWRSLKVGWDESTAGERQRRVSLWEIEPLTTPFLICPPLTLRAKRPRAGFPGEDEVLDGSLRKSPLWLRDDERDSLSSLSFRGLGMDAWTTRLAQNADSVNSGPTSEYYRVMAAAALQEIRANDSSKQMLQRQQQQPLQNHHMQFRQQGQPLQLPQQSDQQQVNLQQQQQQLNMQQQQQVLTSAQPLQLPDVTGPLLQLSSSRPQSPMELPPPMRASSGYTDSDVHISPASTAWGSFPLQSLLNRSQQGGTLPSEETNQLVNLLRNSSSLIQQAPLMSGSGMVNRETPVSTGWFPMRDSTVSDSQAHSSGRVSNPAPVFPVSSNEPCQSVLTQTTLLPGSGIINRETPGSNPWFPMRESSVTDSQAHSSTRVGRGDSSSSPAPTFGAVSSNEPSQSGLTQATLLPASGIVGREPQMSSPWFPMRESPMSDSQAHSSSRIGPGSSSSSPAPTFPVSNANEPCQSSLTQAALLPAPGIVGRDPPGSSSWFSVRESVVSDSQAHSNPRIGRGDSSSSAAQTFALSSNEPCQSGLTALPMQSSPFGAFRDSSQDQDQVQSDPRNHFLFGVSIDQMPNGVAGLGPRAFGKAKDAQARFAGGNLFPPPYCSSAGPDLPVSPGILPHGSLDDNGLMQRGFMPPVTSPQRSYTKVYKLGSVGRSLDVARFTNYADLRAHLARMFGLEGQLEDPQRSGWQLVFVDYENDVLLVGDDPWEEFVNCVRSIRILSPSEVMHMSQEGMELMNIVPPAVHWPTSSGSEDGATMPPAGFEKSCGNETPRGCP